MENRKKVFRTFSGLFLILLCLLAALTLIWFGMTEPNKLKKVKNTPTPTITATPSATLTPTIPVTNKTIIRYVTATPVIQSNQQNAGQSASQTNNPPTTVNNTVINQQPTQASQPQPTTPPVQPTVQPQPTLICLPIIGCL